MKEMRSGTEKNRQPGMGVSHIHSRGAKGCSIVSPCVRCRYRWICPFLLFPRLICQRLRGKRYLSPIESSWSGGGE